MTDKAVAARAGLVLGALAPALGLGVAVFVLAVLSTEFTRVTSGEVAAVWPANAIAVTALLRAPDKHRWRLLAGAFAGNALANLAGGDPLASALWVSFADGVEELICVTLMRGTCGPNPDLTRVDHLLRFVLIGGLLAPLASGLVALPALAQPGHDTGADLLAWFAADSLGLLIVVPAALAFSVEGLRGLVGEADSGRIAVPVLAVAGALVAANLPWTYPLQFLLLPSLLFLAVRLGASAAAIAQLSISAAVVVLAVTGLGGMAFGDDVLERLRAVQAFLVMQSLVILPTSAVLQDRLRLEVDLRAAKDDAEAAASLARTELASREHAERRLDLALKAGHISTFELDAEGDRLAVDEHMVAVLGLRPVAGGMVPLDAVRARLDGQDAGRLASIFERLRSAAGVRAGGAGASLTVGYSRDDGEVRRLQIHAGADTDARSSARILGTIIDITEQTRAAKERALLQSRLQKAEHMRSIGTLAGGIAHDFNNILGAIQGFSSLLEDDLAPASEQHRFASRITATAERGKDIVGQILSFARAGEQERAPTGLDLFLSETGPLLESLAGAHVKLHLVCRDRDLHSAVNIPQLTQVLSNLCKNAGDALEGQGGDVTVEVFRVAAVDAAEMVTRPYRATAEMVGELSSETDYACIRVSDTGPGIAPAALRRIFEPFYTTKGRVGGTGLGLAVVKGAAEDHGGACVVESVVGEGTAFSFFLPLTTAAARPGHNRAGHAGRGTGRVMVVDDEPGIVDALVTALNRQGYQASGFHTATAALDAMNTNLRAWRVLITDQIMPDMRGAELSRACKALRPSLLTVLYSGFDEDLGGQDSPVFDLILRKPLTAQEFVRELDRLVAAAPNPAGSEGVHLTPPDPDGGL